MKEVEYYKNTDFELPAILDEKNEPWFEVKTLCESLNLTNTSRSISNLDSNWIRAMSISNPTYSGKQGQRKRIRRDFVSEAGLYALIFKSRKQEAKDFQKWVFEEVLPQIRQTGSYNTTRGLVAVDYKRLASDIFYIGNDAETSKKRLAIVVNIVNRAVTGMSSKECKEKYNLSPRDWIMKNDKKRIEEYDRIHSFVIQEIERNRFPAQIKDTLKTMGYKV